LRAGKRDAVGPVLAEAVSIDGGLLLLLLVLALLALAFAVAVVVAGFALAPRAARGPGPALVVWVVAVALEVLAWLASVLALVLDGEFQAQVVVLPAIVAGQVFLFQRARRG
jgi:hypothetical protein